MQRQNTEHRTRNSRGRSIIKEKLTTKTHSRPGRGGTTTGQRSQEKPRGRKPRGKTLQETAIISREVPPWRRRGTTFLKVECPRNKIATRMHPSFNCSRRSFPISRRSPDRICANLPDQSGRDAWPNASVWIESSSQMVDRPRLGGGDYICVRIQRASAATA